MTSDEKIMKTFGLDKKEKNVEPVVTTRGKLFLLGLIIGLILVAVLLGVVFNKKDNPQIENDSVGKQIQDKIDEKNLRREYNSQTQTMTLSNPGNGNVETQIRLLTPLNYQVGLGYQKIAEFEINSTRNFRSYLTNNNMEFYNINNNNQPIQRQVDFLVKEEESYEVDDYSEVCGVDVNGSNSCWYEVSGNHLEDREVWNSLSPSLWNNREIYTIGIFTHVNEGDSVEWIPTFDGERITEWAVWNASLEVGLQAYFRLEETSGAPIDFLGNITTNVAGEENIDYRIDGIQLKAYNFTLYDVTNHSRITNTTTTSPVLNITNYPFSVNLWINPNVTQHYSEPNFIQIRNATSTDEIYWVGFNFGTFNISMYSRNAGSAQTSYDRSNSIPPPGTWTMVTAIWNNATGRELWVDGVKVLTSTTNVPYTGGLNQIAFPIYYGGGLDEIGIWNRQLTAADISLLYDGGQGVSPGAIELLLPENNKIIVGKSINFSSLISNSTNMGTIKNVSLYIDGVLNQTNTSGLSGIYNFSVNGLTLGNHNWTMQVYNTTDYLFTAGTRNFEIDWLLFGTPTYTTPITEGSASTFTINITTNGTSLLLGNLTYNGTGNVVSIAQINSSFYTLTKILYAPIVDISTAFQFYWNVTLSTGYYSNSTNYTQTVNPLSIDDCSVYTNVLYNFTIVDEDEQTTLVPSSNNTTARVDLQLYSLGRENLIEQFNKSYSQVNPFAVCLESTTGTYNIDVQVQYTADDYEEELYHIQNDTITSADFPTNITLFDLLTSRSQIFQITFRDEFFIPVPNAIIEIWRKYIDEGVYKIVEIPLTDGNGETIAHLVLDDVIYKFVVKKFGETLTTFDNVLAECQTPLVTSCTINLQANTGNILLPDFEEGFDFNYTLGFNNVTREITSVFVIPSGNPANVTIFVTRVDALGTAICSDSLTASSGTLSCIAPSNFGNETIFAQVYRDGVLQAQGSIKLDLKADQLFGGIWIMLAVFVMLTLFGAGLSDNPVYTVAFLMLGVILLFALNLVSNNGFIGAGATILWLIIAIILVFIKGGKRT